MRRKSRLSWCEKHIYLNGEKFRREDWPLLVAPMECIEQNAAARHLVLGGVQTVKTLLGQLWCASSMQIEPSPTLWYTRTDDQADSFVDLKLNPLIDATQLKDRAFFGDPNKATRKRKQLPSGHSLEVLSAGPTINRQQRSAETVVMDEFWLYDGEWLGEIANRHAAPEFAASWRELFVTTAADEGHMLGKVWDDSTQMKLQWKCAECSKEYVPDFGEKQARGGLKYECKRLPDGRINKAETAKTVHWECPYCSSQTRYSKRFVHEQASRQSWKQCNPSPAPRAFGWWIPDWLVRDWAALVIDWEEANDAKRKGDIEPLRKLILTRFAKPWRRLEVAKGEKRPRNIGDYKMGDLWAGESRDEYGRPNRFLTVDVQKDHYVAVARAWGAGGESRLLEATKCMSAGAVHDMAVRNGIEPFRVFLDARWDQTAVARLCAQYSWRMLMGAKDGDFYHKYDGQRKIFSEPHDVDPFLGTSAEGGNKVLRFLFSKPHALDRLTVLRSEGCSQWSAASDAPDWYWTETEAHYTVEKTKPNGETFREWHGLKDDHAGDCEAMQVVCASIAGLLGNSVSPEAKAPAEAA